MEMEQRVILVGHSYVRLSFLEIFAIKSQNGVVENLSFFGSKMLEVGRPSKFDAEIFYAPAGTGTHHVEKFGAILPTYPTI